MSRRFFGLSRTFSSALKQKRPSFNKRSFSSAKDEIDSCSQTYQRDYERDVRFSLKLIFIGSALEFFVSELDQSKTPSDSLSTPENPSDLIEIPQTSKPLNKFDFKRIPGGLFLFAGTMSLCCDITRLTWRTYLLREKYPVADFPKAGVPRVVAIAVLSWYVATYSATCVWRIELGKPYRVSDLWHPLRNVQEARSEKRKAEGGC